MIIIGGPSDVLFLIWSRGVIASPVSIRIVRIWEQIIIFGRPGDIMTSKCIDIITGSRVSEEVLISMVFVHVLDHVVKTLVVLRGIHISKVISKQHKYIIGKVMCCPIVQEAHQFFCFDVCIEVLRGFVIDPLDIIGAY